MQRRRDDDAGFEIDRMLGLVGQSAASLPRSRLNRLADRSRAPSSSQKSRPVPLLHRAKVVARTGVSRLQIVKRSDAHRFVALPKRWIVERTFAWISRNRRLARDFERYAQTVAAFFRLRIMLRRLTRPTHSA
jgi:DDE family transposase